MDRNVAEGLRSKETITGGIHAVTPDELLANYPPAIRKLTRRLRGVLLAAVPTFEQRALPGWKAISFRDPHAGHVCGLFPSATGVQLYVEYGALLDDPDGLLRGEHMKRGRNIPFRTERDIRVRALTRLIRQAVWLQSV